MTKFCQRILSSAPDEVYAARSRTDRLGRTLATADVRGVVRCVGCDMELQGPARYCQWCGREVSREQIEATHQVSEHKDGAPMEAPAPPAAPPSKEDTVSAKAQPDAEAFWYAAVPSAAPPQGSSQKAPVQAESPRAPPALAATSGADKASGAKADAVVTAVVKTNASLPRRAKTDAAMRKKH